MVTKTIALKVRARDLFKCRGCWKTIVFWSDSLLTKWDIHHVYFKSQYKRKDRDDLRNLVLLCIDCHTWPNGIHGMNRELDRKFKAESDILKPPAERTKDKVTRRKYHSTEAQKETSREYAKQRRERQLRKFRKEHDWYTPNQRAYRQQKEYFKSLDKKNAK